MHGNRATCNWKFKLRLCPPLYSGRNYCLSPTNIPVPAQRQYCGTQRSAKSCSIIVGCGLRVGWGLAAVPQGIKLPVALLATQTRVGRKHAIRTIDHARDEHERIARFLSDVRWLQEASNRLFSQSSTHMNTTCVLVHYCAGPSLCSQTSEQCPLS